MPDTIDLSAARVFKESARNTSARWYILPDGRTFTSRARGHLEPSIHSATELENRPELVEES